MVQAQALVCGGRLGLSLVERPHPGSPSAEPAPTPSSADADAWSRLRDQTRGWPLHWFWIEADNQSLRIESSPLPTVPVFLTSTDGCARAHWDPLRLYPFVRPRLDWEAAAYFLSTFEQPYGGTTLIEGVHHLAGGYVAEWNSCGWRLRPPASSPASYPRLLRPEADPARTFETLVAAASERLAGSAGEVAAGLSGGLDSTLVCGTLARQGHTVRSFGILVPGADGEPQRERRAAVVEHFGLLDHAHPIGPGYSPWSSGAGCSFRDATPWDELYGEPFEALYRHAAAAGQQVFFTGLGGDDLLASYWDELPDRGAGERAELSGEIPLPAFLGDRVRDGHAARTAALNDLPRAFAQRGVLESAAGMAAEALRHGLWPIHPLITPEVVRYCHALPMAYRQERRLVREVLAGWGLPRAVSHPAATESFAECCSNAMRQCPGFARLLRAPRLADLGLVDPAGVQQGFRDWLAGAPSAPRDTHLVAIATLEATLESLESAPTDRRAESAPHLGALPVEHWPAPQPG